MIEERLSSKEMAGLEADYEKISQIKKLIMQRELEIEWPFREFRDSNVGGGRTTIRQDKAQKIVEKKEADQYLQRLYRLAKIKKLLITKMNDEQKKIYKMKYCSDYYMDWISVGELIGLKKSKIYRKRYELLELLAKQEGILPI